MGLPKSPNPIDFATIRSFFTGDMGPHQFPRNSLGDYYRNLYYVNSDQYGWPADPPPDGRREIIPSSGAISFANFRGVEKTIAETAIGPMNSNGRGYILSGDRTWYIKILSAGGGGGGSCVPYWGGLYGGPGGSGGVTYAEYTITPNGQPTYITLHPGGAGGVGLTQTYNNCPDFRGSAGVNGYSSIYSGGAGGGAGYSHLYYDQTYADGGAGGGGGASIVTVYNALSGASWEVISVAPGGGGGTYNNPTGPWTEPRTSGNMQGTIRYALLTSYGWYPYTIGRTAYYAYICYGNPLADINSGDPTVAHVQGQNGYDGINNYGAVAIRQAPTAEVPCGQIVGYYQFVDLSVHNYGYVRRAGGCGGGGGPNGLSGLFTISPASRAGNFAGYGAAGSAGNLYIRSSFVTPNIARTTAQYTLPPQNTRIQTNDGRVTYYGQGGVVGSNGTAGAISISISDFSNMRPPPQL